MSTPGKTEDERLFWLVEHRSRIQELSLNILGVMRENDVAVSKDDVVRATAGLLIGCAFSLWRAVFLTHPAQDWSTNVDTGLQYITKVIKDNSIMYGDDDRMRHWAFGYYSGNAFYRIRDICERMPELVDALRAAGFPDYRGSGPPHVVETSDVWNQHFRALEVAMRCFCARLRHLQISN